ncbi:MAG: LptF/LptG family permease [Sphingobacteriales bacterium]|jgi:lipopolysaccharide export system permease protein|nr:LptF/LptG family permease [Sphingobacteriales bacterium]
MKIIDKYILSKFLTTFFFCLILFTAIVVVVDISEKADDFAKSKLSFWQITTDYYFGFIPRIDAMLFPLFVFISVIFFTSKMAGRSEIIAILSSGVSLKRFLLPYLIGAFILTGLLWGGYQYLVPRANRKWDDFQKHYVNVGRTPTPDNSSYKQNLYFRIDANTYAGIKGYDTISKTGSNIAIQRFANNQMQYNLRALSFKWDTVKKNWILNNVIERDIHPINETVKFSQAKMMNYSFKPIDLRKDEYLKDQMTTPDLEAFIKLEKMRGSEMLSTLQVERYNRDAIPVSVIILTIIGAVLASRKVRGGSGFHLALGILISVTYILFSRFSVVFATKGTLTPWIAAWLPNFIFGILAIYLYYRAPK